MEGGSLSAHSPCNTGMANLTLTLTLSLTPLTSPSLCSSGMVTGALCGPQPPGTQITSAACPLQTSWRH